MLLGALKRVQFMFKRNETDFLLDILEATERILLYVAEMTYEQFHEDIKTQDAVIRNLEIIGESTKNLSRQLRDAYPKVPWKGMAGIRDRLIHDYFGVNLDIVWDIVITELPSLRDYIGEILKNHQYD